LLLGLIVIIVSNTAALNEATNVFYIEK